MRLESELPNQGITYIDPIGLQPCLECAYLHGLHDPLNIFLFCGPVVFLCFQEGQFDSSFLSAEFSSLGRETSCLNLLTLAIEKNGPKDLTIPGTYFHTQSLPPTSNMHSGTKDSAIGVEEPSNLESPRSSSPLDLLALISTASPHHPSHWPSWKKWSIAIIYCLLQVAIMLLSITYTSAQAPLHTKFGGSTQIIALGQSIFIFGNAAGPVFLGPLSDLVGRKWVYVGSVALYGLCQIV